MGPLVSPLKTNRHMTGQKRAGCQEPLGFPYAVHVASSCNPAVSMHCVCIFLFPTNAKWQPMYVVHGLGISAKAIWLPMCLHYIFMLFFHLVFCATKSSKLPMFYKVFMFPSYLQFISSPLIDNTYVILSPTMPSNFIFFLEGQGPPMDHS